MRKRLIAVGVVCLALAMSCLFAYFLISILKGMENTASSQAVESGSNGTELSEGAELPEIDIPAASAQSSAQSGSQESQSGDTAMQGQGSQSGSTATQGQGSQSSGTTAQGQGSQSGSSVQGQGSQSEDTATQPSDSGAQTSEPTNSGSQPENTSEPEPDPGVTPTPGQESGKSGVTTDGNGDVLLPEVP